MLELMVATQSLAEVIAQEAEQAAVEQATSGKSEKFDDLFTGEMFEKVRKDNPELTGIRDDGYRCPDR